jgi:nitrogen fixation protein NifU and related proteins
MTAFPSPSAEPAKIEELYQSVILDHNRRPRNHREMEDADGRAEGKNPNCGDRVIVWLRLDGDTVADVSFKVPQGEGCAISRASASLMTTTIKGKTVVEAEALFDRFIALLTASRPPRATSGAADRRPAIDARTPAGDDPSPGPADLGSLEVFSGVSRFPHRVKCATMAWHALHAALGEAVAGTADT